MVLSQYKRSKHAFIAVDIGNTAVCAAVFHKCDLQVQRWEAEGYVEIPLSDSRTFADILSRSFGVSLAGAVIGSVVESRFTQTAAAAVESVFGLTPLIAECGMETGLKIKYENPNGLGIDRLANAASLFALTRGSCIAVDLGTATTFDCISKDGVYIGGAIMAGLDSFRKALAFDAPALPDISLDFPSSAIGSNTEDCIKSGTMFGYAHMVDGMVRALSSEMKDKPQVVATGGFSALLSGECETFSGTDRLLTLKGLVIILLKNGKVFSL